MRSAVSLFLLAFLASLATGAAESPLAVSPGDPAKLALVESRCPTFSWGEVEGAKSYELVVYRVDDRRGQAEPVLRQTFVGSAQSWTPALDQCLERGGRYAWSVRAVDGKTESDWSAPSLFGVVGGPSEAEFEAALEIVRQYVAKAGVEARSEDQWSASTAVQSPRGASSGLQVSDPPAPLVAAAGDSDLMVNGAAVVTTATLGAGVGAQLCLAVDYRFIDQGDGTVLDCSTGLIWLKNANCAVYGSWQEAKDWAASLASGACGLTDGSSAGDWRLPKIGEFCSEDAPTPSEGLCPSANASDSLVNTNFSNPAMSNAAGDGPWAADDAFVGLGTGAVNTYWSSTEHDVNLAWRCSFNGFVTYDLKSDTYLAWAIRDGQ